MLRGGFGEFPLISSRTTTSALVDCIAMSSSISLLLFLCLFVRLILRNYAQVYYLYELSLNYLIKKRFPEHLLELQIVVTELPSVTMDGSNEVYSRYRPKPKDWIVESVQSITPVMLPDPAATTMFSSQRAPWVSTKGYPSSKSNGKSVGPCSA